MFSVESSQTIVYTLQLKMDMNIIGFDSTLRQRENGHHFADNIFA